MTISAKQPCAEIWRNPIHFFALGFGSGCAPRAPGTCGTLVAVPLCWLLQTLTLFSYFLAIGTGFVIGVWLCDRTTRDLEVHDHPSIVWDEIIGYWITMIAAPPGWEWLVIGFVLFRLFDIFKPWPIRMVDKHIGGGFGIMFDDVLAAFYAWLVLQSLAWLV
jgi:phosphatidylglycerophosphatase A